MSKKINLTWKFVSFNLKKPRANFVDKDQFEEICVVLMM